MSVKKIVVLVSGGGTNLQSLIDQVHKKDGEITCVISDTPDVYALTRAEQAGIAHTVFDYSCYEQKSLFFEALIKKIDSLSPDLIVLAGFMKILPQVFYDAYINKIINIHPSLIPSFCGKGYYGIKVHEAVLDYGAKVSGATVHFADGGADTGPIIMQECISIAQNDTPESLQKKILQIEHRILPKAVSLFLQDKITVDGRNVTIYE